MIIFDRFRQYKVEGITVLSSASAKYHNTCRDFGFISKSDNIVLEDNEEGIFDKDNHYYANLTFTSYDKDSLKKISKLDEQESRYEYDGRYWDKIGKNALVVINDADTPLLHPEDKVQAARNLVHWAKEMNWRVLLYSTDMIFLRALEVYSDLEDTMDTLNVYMVDRDGNLKNISYCEYGISELYEELSNNFDYLEKLLEEAYDK